MLPFEFHNLNKSACHSVVITQWNFKCLYHDGSVGICESDTLWLCYVYYTGYIHGNGLSVFCFTSSFWLVGGKPNQIRDLPVPLEEFVKGKKYTLFSFIEVRNVAGCSRMMNEAFHQSHQLMVCAWVCVATNDVHFHACGRCLHHCMRPDKSLKTETEMFLHFDFTNFAGCKKKIKNRTEKGKALQVWSRKLKTFHPFIYCLYIFIMTKEWSKYIKFHLNKTYLII